MGHSGGLQRSWKLWLLFLGLILPCAVFAHERFIKHDLLRPIHRDFYLQTNQQSQALIASAPCPVCGKIHSAEQKPVIMGINPNMLNIALRVYLLMAFLLILWFLRRDVHFFIANRILPYFHGNFQKIVNLVANYLTDRRIDDEWFKRINEWVVILFLRCPALVLLYSAANDSLIMPSYPLEPSTAAVFKYAQVVMAIGIITQTFLPFGGATIIGTVLYLIYAYDWKVAVDVLPVLTVAAVYVTSPWKSHLAPITELSKTQMRWVRLILGFAFFALGWMKLYNHDLTAGVADNYPQVLDDPLIKLFYVGTDPTYQRECWITAFGLVEVLTGFLVMIGAFCRFWALQMAYVFTKLMLVDFGWAEIVHLYPIAAFLLIAFSNNLSGEFFGEGHPDATAAVRMGRKLKSYIKVVSAAVVLAALAVFPMLYLLTLVRHP